MENDSQDIMLELPVRFFLSQRTPLETQSLRLEAEQGVIRSSGVIGPNLFADGGALFLTG
jgi:hypothetical protein